MYMIVMSRLELDSISHSAIHLQTWTLWTTIPMHHVYFHAHSYLISDHTHYISTLTASACCEVFVQFVLSPDILNLCLMSANSGF